MKTFYVSLAVLASALLFTGAAMSQEQGTDQAQARTAIKTRVMSEEDRLKLFEIQEKPSDQDGEKAPARSATGRHAYVVYDNMGWDLHQAVNIDPFSCFITLEDGSVFSVPSRYQFTVSYWPINSYIQVLPNHGYFFGLLGAGYDVCLYNADTGETIEADLYAGPYLFGNTSEWVTAVDSLSGYVWLKDGTCLEVHPDDICLLWDWQINEHVIIGTNDDSYSYSYPNILLNVADINYVRVRYVY